MGKNSFTGAIPRSLGAVQGHPSAFTMCSCRGPHHAFATSYYIHNGLPHPPAAQC